jgi:hypothetical protein
LSLCNSPINRGVEIDSDVADSEHSIILNQVENVAIRMLFLPLAEKIKPKHNFSNIVIKLPVIENNITTFLI